MIYAMRAGDSGPIKIGFASDLNRRHGRRAMTRAFAIALYLHAATAHPPVIRGPSFWRIPHASTHRTAWIAPGTRLSAAGDRTWWLAP